jgi:hypothetical protein
MQTPIGRMGNQSTRESASQQLTEQKHTSRVVNIVFYPSSQFTQMHPPWTPKRHPLHHHHPSLAPPDLMDGTRNARTNSDAHKPTPTNTRTMRRKVSGRQHEQAVLAQCGDRQQETAQQKHGVRLHVANLRSECHRGNTHDVSHSVRRTPTPRAGHVHWRGQPRRSSSSRCGRSS